MQFRHTEAASDCHFAMEMSLLFGVEQGFLAGALVGMVVGAALQHLLQNLQGNRVKKRQMKTEAEAPEDILCITCREDAVPLQVYVAEGKKFHKQQACRGLNAASRVRALKVRVLKPCQFCGL